MTALSAVLAIDQGTTGTTALVVATDGRLLSRAYSEFTQHFPQPGWVEHDALEIWEVTRRVSRQALDAAGSGVRVEAVGITNQRETVVLWDRETLEPVHRAIVWQDRRTASICRELKERGLEEEVRERTGLLFDPYFSGTKLTWLLRNHPELRGRAEAGELAAGTVDSWLVARLTRGEVHATDHTNASRTLLYNLERQGWDEKLLGILEVPSALLPDVRSSSGIFGVAAGEELGLEVPIGGVAGDQQAALFGQGCWSEGLAKNTYGTGAFLLLNTGQKRVRSTSGLLTTMACDESGAPAYALEGSIFVAGAAIQWLRDGLGVLESAQESEALAASLTSNDGVYFVPAFVGLGAPHWDPHARGMLVGLTRGTERAHLARAALEAMAYSTADVLGAMEKDSGVDARELRVDGGAAMNDWLMEFQAGILGIPARRPSLVETTALGAAGLAGTAVGVWSTGSELMAALGESTVFEPSMSEADRRTCLEGWRRALGAVKVWSEGEVS
ncbi:MAG: glycerol kinase GlpK [Gemmatimonadota bacterium]|jgi:glycerol kinase